MNEQQVPKDRCSLCWRLPTLDRMPKGWAWNCGCTRSIGDRCGFGHSDIPEATACWESYAAQMKEAANG